MESSLLRARIATGEVKHLSDLLPKRGGVAVLVTSPSCVKCAEFETEYLNQAEERGRRELGSFLTFRCSSPPLLDLALESGIESVPKIVLLRPSSKMEVVDAFKFARSSR